MSNVKFKPCTQRRYNEQLEVLPPLAWCYKGFLVSEPWTHRNCEVTGRYSPTYQAMIKRGSSNYEHYYESMVGITVAEWKALDLTKLQIVDPSDDHGGSPTGGK